MYGKTDFSYHTNLCHSFSQKWDIDTGERENYGQRLHGTKELNNIRECTASNSEFTTTAK